MLATQNRLSCDLQFNCRELEKPLDLRVESKVVRQSPDNRQLLVVLSEIGVQKRAERALVERDRLIRSIADSLPVLIGYLDPNLRYQFGNAAYADWCGLQSEALLGQSVEQVLGSTVFQAAEQSFAKALAGQRQEFETVLTHRRKGPREVQVFLESDLALDGTIRGVHFLCIDISERKIVEQQTERRQHLTERLARLKPAERATYELLIRGESNKAIAHQLDIGLRTAERRRRIVLDKLGAGSLAELLQELADIQGVGPA